MQTYERRVQCSNENHSKRSLNERVSGMRSERKERTTVHALHVCECLSVSERFCECSQQQKKRDPIVMFLVLVVDESLNGTHAYNCALHFIGAKV